jgi:histidine triad (HIT) family protein
MTCLLCDIVARRERSSIVAETDTILALCDIHPVNPGHVLVITKSHAKGLDDVDPAAGAEMFTVAQQVAKAIRRTDLRCEGIDLFLADGEAAFQEVFHIHLHVIPRYRGDNVRLESGQPTTPVAWVELDRIAAAIRNARSGLRPIPAPPGDDGAHHLTARQRQPARPPAAAAASSPTARCPRASPPTPTS